MFFLFVCFFIVSFASKCRKNTIIIKIIIYHNYHIVLLYPKFSEYYTISKLVYENVNNEQHNKTSEWYNTFVNYFYMTRTSFIYFTMSNHISMALCS